MKILYISPENTVGTMALWKEIHQKNGNECEQSPEHFPHSCGERDVPAAGVGIECVDLSGYGAHGHNG